MAKKQEPNQGLQELKAALSRKETCGAYVFYGEEVFLMHYYLDRLKKLAVDEVTESFNFHELNPETFSMDALSEAVEALPMMAEQTMTVVDEVDFFAMDEGSRERMGAIFNDLPDYCTLVFTYETTPWKPDKRYKKLWEAVSKHAKLVEFPKQDRRELVSWVIRHFSARGKVISQQLAGYLIDLTDGTMTALSGEIAKIAAFSGAQEIVKADIDAVTEPVLDAVVFQMTDLMAAGNFGGALLKLQQLFKMQQEPIAILGAVGSYFRRLNTARSIQESGGGEGDVMRLCGVASYPARLALGACRKFSKEFYRKAAELVLETDYAMKTSYDEKERLLELLVLRLSQEARHG